MSEDFETHTKKGAVLLLFVNTKMRFCGNGEVLLKPVDILSEKYKKI